MGKCVITFEDGKEDNEIDFKLEFDPPITKDGGGLDFDGTTAQRVGADMAAAIMKRMRAAAEGIDVTVEEG